MSNNKFPKNKIDALHALFNQTTDIVIITDVDGMIEWVNDGFESLTEYTRDESIGKTPGSLLQGPDTDPVVVNKLSQAIKNVEPINVDILNYTKHGRSYWLRLYIRPVFKNLNVLTGFAGTEFDLTDQYALRDQLMNINIKLQKTIDEKDFFIGILSHDIKNSVGIVYSLSSIMSESINMFTPQKMEHYAQLIHRQSDYTLKTLKNIVEISKKNNEEYAIIELNNLILSCLQKLYISYASKKISVVSLVDNSVLISAVPISLEIILNNIITNSIKFTPENGCITIQYEHNELFYFISVIDDGIGFKKYGDGDNDNIKYHHGNISSGYGLYICKELTNKMSGELIINKDCDIGAIVVIKLPIR